MAAACRPSCPSLLETSHISPRQFRCRALQRAIARPTEFGSVGPSFRFQESLVSVFGQRSNGQVWILCSKGRGRRCGAAISCSVETRDLPFYSRVVKAAAVAWEILFPPPERPPSIAEIAKERLRVVLISDRGQVSPEVRRLIKSRIIEAISDFVEVLSEDEVQVKTTADPGLGTIYSVTVPVRRVKPEFQEFWGDNGVGFRDRAYEDLKHSQTGGRLLTMQLNPLSSSIQFEGILEDPERG